MQKSGRNPQTLPSGASSLGLQILLASLAVLFLATLFCGWYFRDTGASEGPLPALPVGIWLTTLLLAGVSLAVEKGVRSARRSGAAVAARKGVQVSMVFGVAFLLGQFWNWTVLIESQTGARVHPLFAFNFYLMTALHAVHIVGGLVYGGLSLRSLAQKAEYAQQRVRNLAHYWHFLAGTWVAILLNLHAIRIPHPEESFLAPLSLGITILLLVGILFYQALAVRILYRRGEKTFAFFSLILPIAFLHILVRGEELGTQKMALRWGFLQAMLLVSAMFTGTLYLGQFVGNFERITY